MPPVFAHGRLRLYLLGLLDEAPRHGYEVIRLLEERFHGLYAPSAGTVYPRLAKLEAEGLVTHTTEGGRKVYSITDAGREELAGRSGELADLELEIRDSVSELAAAIRDDVRGAAGTLRREMRAAAGEARTPGGDDWAAWRQAKQEWKEQARRAKDESRRAREDARSARRQAQEAQERARQEMQRIAQQVQEQVLRGGSEGLADLAGRLGGLIGGAPTTPWPPCGKPDPAETPEWAHAPAAGSDDPARDLERLLDRFRDDIRDAARDHGVTAAQLAEARRHLSTAAAHIVTLLRGGGAGD
ncbi:helix-turn-helix transcriptional regulator [Streptomyces ficellus]|uniref:Helix-turn-helix transcriptional regulator n=1 Tax=Streptomyces ficellus TaxID=1977088 RepID=A0ABT7ZBZ2_9ACTN|nr:helix-turn-helix transcriptional regulator [Streptomyces ficellus]MDN3297019.1 helix-turn-helix transcriptional regulator [Streptomyces ficellus]